MAAVFLELPPYVPDEAPDLAVKRLHSYLYQAAERMNEAMRLLDQSVMETAQAARQDLTKATQDMQAGTQRVNRTQTEALLREAGTLRSLIIDNADAIARTEERIINELESSYVAKSEFGTYQEQAATQMVMTADNAIINYNASETITGLKTFQKDYDEYIKVGLLFRDSQDNRVYGVAVGENLKRVTQIVDGHEVTVLENTNLAAVFTATKLSFYERGTEVAYISQHKLTIMQAAVSQRLQLGKLIFSVDENGIAATWAPAEGV